VRGFSPKQINIKKYFQPTPCPLPKGKGFLKEAVPKVKDELSSQKGKNMIQ